MAQIYLASPYASTDKQTIEERVTDVTKAAAILMTEGHNPYSPVVHGHAVQQYLHEDLSCEHAFWLEKDFPQVIAADYIYVLEINGWQFSKGVRWECETGWAFGIPVYLFNAVTKAVIELHETNPPWNKHGV